MPVTFYCQHIGQKKADMTGAFTNRSVFLSNIYKQLTNEEYKSIQVFHTRKEAVIFCKTWGFSQSEIVKVSSRFQFGWAIGLGRSHFAPEHAEGLLIANRLGCEVTRIKDERMGLIIPS